MDVWPLFGLDFVFARLGWYYTIRLAAPWLSVFFFADGIFNGRLSATTTMATGRSEIAGCRRLRGSHSIQANRTRPTHQSSRRICRRCALRRHGARYDSPLPSSRGGVCGCVLACDGTGSAPVHQLGRARAVRSRVLVALMAPVWTPLFSCPPWLTTWGWPVGPQVRQPSDGVCAHADP